VTASSRSKTARNLAQVVENIDAIEAYVAGLEESAFIGFRPVSAAPGIPPVVYFTGEAFAKTCVVISLGPAVLSTTGQGLEPALIAKYAFNRGRNGHSGLRGDIGHGPSYAGTDQYDAGGVRRDAWMAQGRAPAHC